MLTRDETLIQKRFVELAEKCYSHGIYTYTDFLGIADMSLFYQVQSKISYIPFAVDGGHPSCERRIIQFGSKELCGYDESFPIAVLQIAPAHDKFSDSLTHRDYLGALLNLGIERSTMGDIFIKNNQAWLFCKVSIAKFIQETLVRVRHTVVTTNSCSEVPTDCLPRLEPVLLSVSSERLDAILSSLYKFSRSLSIEAFHAGRVFLNGRLCENNSKTPSPGDLISLRGKGRFYYDGIHSVSKKGRLHVNVRVFY